MAEYHIRDQEFIESLAGIILSNLPDENFGAKELAQEKCMSQRKLSHRLRSITNKSISQFIRETRLQKALELLQKEDLTASEVAYKVGFGSATYFNKCFHEFFGIPPGKIGKEEPQDFKPLVRKSIKQTTILIFAGLLILSGLVFILGGLLFYKKQTKIQWAKNVAIPEIEKMIKENDNWRNLVEPYRLAEKAEIILKDDKTLDFLIHKCSRRIDITTNPAGAGVYMKEYIHPEAEWTFIGVTPLKSVRVPIGIFRWMIEKKGYDTIMAAASTWDIASGDEMIFVGSNFFRKLDKKDSIPSGMVRVPASETEAGHLEDFFISRFEVTNSEYKAFVDSGGYRNRDYWQYPFIKDSLQISFDDAIMLFVDQTGRPGPAAWIGGDFPEGQGNYPVSGVSWYEAAAYAEWAGKSLPTSTHWNVARGGLTPMIHWFTLGGFGIFAPFTNFSGKGPNPVGSLPGVTAFGAYDMAGNVREWCWNETVAGKIIRGGSWQDNSYEFENERQAPPMDRSQRNGLRLAFYPEKDSVPSAAFEFRNLFFKQDFSSQKPVSDDIFTIYKEQFSYDPGELNSKIESRTEVPEGWIHERISFDAAYGKEKVLAHLFLPANVKPPYQTVIYFPGSSSTLMHSSEGLEDYYEFYMYISFLLRNGRAILYPVYKGTFERGSPEYISLLNDLKLADTHAYSELLFQQVKDIRRSIDYLQTRNDIDGTKIAYLGMSWGANQGCIIPAVENRFKASVLIGAGLTGLGRPEARDLTYVSRVITPTIILNGKYDTGFPPETSSKPMFNLLGTPREHKRLILYETDHIPPRTEYIKETLAWLDKYLGLVK